MIISKNDKFVEFLRTLTEFSKTPNCSTVVSKIEFIEGNGICFYFSENIERIFIKNKNVDFSRYVEGDIFITATLAELSAGDVEIKYEQETNSVILNNKFSFNSFILNRNFTDSIIEDNDIFFSKEQWDNLAEDFKFTLGCCFTNPKTADTIGFANNQGTLYKLLPGTSAYVIDKFDASVNETSMSQNYGHSSNIWLMPRKVYDLICSMNESTVFIRFEDDNIKIETENMFLVYKTTYMGNGCFKRRLSLISTGTNNLIDITLLKELISNVKNLVGFCFENGEDKNLQLSIADGLATISIEELTTKIKIKQTSDTLKLCANFNFISYIVDKLSNNAVIIDSSCNEEDIYLIKDGNRNIFFNKIDYLD